MLVLLDIALVSAIFYVLLTWMRVSIPRSTSRRIVLTALVVAAVYILARAFELFMLERVIEVLLIVLLIGLVVVFQSDIRRMLDRVVGPHATRHAPSAHESTTVNVLAEAAAKMADMRMGALIAIRGREPWNGHVQGGIDLRGVVSQPLLYSLFHPATPGHDGAVLIENGRIIKFAAHLPLAPNLPEISRYGGTRHAAALGLSDECDALVIVVSEERGAISVAQGGTLTEAVTPSELKHRLEQFWLRHYQETDRHRPWWRKPNLQVALLSITLAVLVWLFFVYSPSTIRRTFVAPIELRNLPENWTVEGTIPPEAEVVLTGSEEGFRRLDPENLTISIDLSEPRAGPAEIAIAEEDLRLPAGIDLEEANPRILRIQLQRLQSIRVPVRIRTTGALPDSLVLVQVRAEPDTVTLMMPEESADRLREVYTEAVDLEQITESTMIQTRIIPPPDARLPAEASPDVRVHMYVRPESAPADTLFGQ